MLEHNNIIRNIHCLALNYVGVGSVREDPIYFLKSTSCLTYDGSIIPYPTFQTNKVWTEVEVGILVSGECENIPPEGAHHFIEGFFTAADITCENINGRDHHLAFSKARTGFCPVRVWNVQRRKIDFKKTPLIMETWINGNLTQQGSTDCMIYDPYKSLSYISKLVRLQKGDIILTGTPKGAENNIVNPGDYVEHKIESVGSLEYSFSL